MELSKNSVSKYFVIFALAPAFIISIILTIISTKTVYRVKVDDTKDMLRGIAKELVYSYELYNKENIEFRRVDNIFYIGDHQVSGDYSIIDRLKEYSDVDLTLFYEDTRIVTTLFDDKGKRIVNTTSSDVWNNFVKNGVDYFAEDVDINGVKYFGYYTPVHASDNSIVGMGFAGRPSVDVRNTILTLKIKTVIACIILCIFEIIAVAFITGRLVRVQSGILKYISEIDKGNFNHNMPDKILKRKDEYGIMGRSFVNLNDSLCNLIQNDALTGLFNRRAAMNYLNTYVASANEVDGEPFTFAIGDIDFFKKVNDTYGHNCGDEVLRRVSKVISQISGDEGFACRWGGEEFVIVFRDKLEPSLKKLEKIAQEIRDLDIEYDNYNVKVTMTFGITEYIAPKKIDWLISNADVLLYKGKESGRNKIVS